MTTTKSNTPKSGTTESGTAGATFTGDIPADVKTVAGEGAAGGPSIKSVPPQAEDTMGAAEADAPKWHSQTRWRIALGVAAAAVLGAVGYKVVKVVKTRRAANALNTSQPGSVEHQRLLEVAATKPMAVPQSLMKEYLPAQPVAPAPLMQ